MRKNYSALREIFRKEICLVQISMLNREISMRFLVSIFIVFFGFADFAFASCSGSCCVSYSCGMKKNECCGGSLGCVRSGTMSVMVKELPFGGVAASGSGGCSDNTPSAFGSLPITWESVIYKQIPATITYSTYSCTCR